jgi:recombination protein RecA
MLGTGGWQRGRIAELYGGEGAGKTTLLLEAIAQAQLNGGVGALIDADHGSSPDAVARIGVDTQALILHQTNVLEEAFKTIEDLIKRNVDVIALDSIASLLLEADHRNGSEQCVRVKHETHQKAVEVYLKALLTPLSKSRSVLLITNQLRERAGVMFGDINTVPWETFPIRDYTSQRVEVRKVTPIKKGDTTLGYETRARVVKNRFAPPLVSVEFELYYATGISEEPELVKLGLQIGVLTRSGKHICFGELTLGREQSDTIQHLRREPELAQQIKRAILTRSAPITETAADPTPFISTEVTESPKNNET